jgi:hypothetical protein
MKRQIAVLTLALAALWGLSLERAHAHGHCQDSDAACKAQREAKKAAFHKACDGDIKSYCSNVADAAKEKHWEVIKCLRTNENSLSSACKTALPTRGSKK